MTDRHERAEPRYLLRNGTPYSILNFPLFNIRTNGRQGHLARKFNTLANALLNLRRQQPLNRRIVRIPVPCSGGQEQVLISSCSYLGHTVQLGL